MRHGVFGRKLSRNTNERKRLFTVLTQQLVVYGGITTTLAKAKAVQPMVEKLITKSKKEKGWALARFPNRKSGYTRIVKLGTRYGDGAEQVKFSFVDPKPEVKVEEPKKVVKKKYAKTNKTNKSK